MSILVLPVASEKYFGAWNQSVSQVVTGSSEESTICGKPSEGFTRLL